MPNQNHPRIIIYSHDSHGIGNIRRLLVIAQHLVAQNPRLSILIISGSPMLQAFRLPERIDYIKLPCLRRTHDGDYAVKSLHFDAKGMFQLRSNIILSTVLDFDPDLILVDKKPLGVAGELNAVFELLARRKHRARRVLLLPDILSSGAKTAAIWEKRGYHHVIDGYYDQILVAGSAKIFDVCREYDFPLTTQKKVRFCGYLETDLAAPRAPASAVAEPRMLVAGGMGQDGDELLLAYLEGLRTTEFRQNVQSVIVWNPGMDSGRRQQLEALAADVPRLSLHAFNNDFLACLADADLVVCRGGYNTVCDVLASGKRALVIPGKQAGEGQRIRAERLSRQGLFRTLHPTLLTPAALMAALQQELTQVAVPAPMLDPMERAGLPNIAAALATWLPNTTAYAGPHQA